MNQHAGVEAFGNVVIRYIQKPLSDDAIGIAILRHQETVNSLARGIESCGRRIDLKMNFVVDIESGQACQHADLNEFFLQCEDFNVGLLGESQDGPFIELNLRPPFLAGIDPVCRLQRHIYAGCVPVDITGMLEADAAFQVRHPGNTGIVRRSRYCKDAAETHQCHQQQRPASHVRLLFVVGFTT
jgi:hypothetical protein